MLFRDVLREPCDIRWCQVSFRWRFYNALPSRKATVGILSDDWEISQREDVIYDLSVTVKDRHEILVYPKPDSKLVKQPYISIKAVYINAIVSRTTGFSITGQLIDRRVKVDITKGFVIHVFISDPGVPLLDITEFTSYIRNIGRCSILRQKTVTNIK